MKAGRKALLRAAFAGWLSLVLAGCATTRSEVAVQAPAASSTPVSSVGAGKTVYLRTVTDDRVFEEAPKDPSTPSLGFGGAAAATADVKARAIGRKRGGFGQAFGDVLLQDGQSAAGLVRESTAAALRNLGYTVVDQPTPGAIVVDVSVHKLWAWFTPGFWSVTLAANAESAVAVTVGGQKSQHLVSAHVEDSMQVVVESDWVKIIGQALAKYQENAQTELGTLP